MTATRSTGLLGYHRKKNDPPLNVRAVLEKELEQTPAGFRWHRSGGNWDLVPESWFKKKGTEK